MLHLLLVGAAAAMPAVTPYGSCPDTMRFEISGLTPGAELAVLIAEDFGAVPLPAGPCAGTYTGQNDPRFWGRTTDRDADGVVGMELLIPPPLCDEALVVVDLATCAVSTPVELDTRPGCKRVGGANTKNDDTIAVGRGAPLAMPYVAPADAVADRLEVWTGAVEVDARLELWANDPRSDSPSVPLATGSWRMSRWGGWQGADLDAAVELVAYEKYWVVWENIDGSTYPRAPTGDAVAFRYKVGDADFSGWEDAASTAELKFKVMACD